ncbi:FMN-binding protein [Clostridium sp. DL1XJH146]
MKKTKKLFIVVVMLAIVILFSLPLSKIQHIYEDGVYEGIGEGHHGDIKVSVLIEDSRIRGVKIIEEQETPELMEIVYANIPERVIKANSSDVKVVAGATLTSKGLINAIEDAIDKARVKE